MTKNPITIYTAEVYDLNNLFREIHRELKKVNPDLKYVNNLRADMLATITRASRLLADITGENLYEQTGIHQFNKRIHK